jgi:phosphatidylinositol alpha 1,6-mannosyltransferase
MNNVPRIALFPDTYHEVNGAANVLRKLVKFAEEHEYPMLCFIPGAKTEFREQGSVQICELKRGKLSIPIDGELKFDPLFWRHKKVIGKKLKEFKPDVIHLTGLNDVSQIGFYFAHFLDVPAVASWHTNTHEYAASRLLTGLRWLSPEIRETIRRKVENGVMTGLMKLYFLAQVQLAPNEELTAQIQKMTRRPSFLMSRGVDTEFLNPAKRKRDDQSLVLGYVGRLRPEKNVRLFARIETELTKANISDYRIVMVGEGDEAGWLKENLKKGELPGTLRGEALAEAYANMDLFVFPSETDAFGNVVLEAMASGVPGVVTPHGGPKFLIEHGVNGFVAQDETEFVKTVVDLAQNRPRLSEMRKLARAAACERSWERVFETLYENYRFASTVSKKVRV